MRRDHQNAGARAEAPPASVTVRRLHGPGRMSIAFGSHGPRPESPDPQRQRTQEECTRRIAKLRFLTSIMNVNTSLSQIDLSSNRDSSYNLYYLDRHSICPGRCREWYNAVHCTLRWDCSAFRGLSLPLIHGLRPNPGHQRQHSRPRYWTQTGASVAEAAVTVDNAATGSRAPTRPDDEATTFSRTFRSERTRSPCRRPDSKRRASLAESCLNAGTEAVIDAQLKVGSTSTSIEVTGGAPVVEPSRTNIGPHH